MVSTSGITIYRHFCGNNFIKTTIAVKPDKCCKGPCKGCHNESKYFVLKGNFEANRLNLDFRSHSKTLINFPIVPVNLYLCEYISMPAWKPDSGSKPWSLNPSHAEDKSVFLQVLLI